MEAVMKSFLSSEAESGQWCDVSLLCRDRKFAAHRVVLSSVSPFLREALLSSTQDTPTVIVLPDFEPKVLELLLQYIYHGEVVLNDGDLVEFIGAAKVMQITIDETSMHDIKQKFTLTGCLNNSKEYTCRTSRNGIKNAEYEEKNNKSEIDNSLCQKDGINEDLSNIMQKPFRKFDFFKSKSDEKVVDLDILIKSDKISKHSSFLPKDFELLEKCYSRRISEKKTRSYMDRLKNVSNKIKKSDKSSKTPFLERSGEEAIDQGLKTQTELINETQRQNELISSRLCSYYLSSKNDSIIPREESPSHYIGAEQIFKSNEDLHADVTLNNQAVNSLAYPITASIEAKQAEDNIDNQKDTRKSKVIRPIPSLMPIHAMLGMSHLTKYYNEMTTGHGLLDLSLSRTKTIPDIYLDQTHFQKDLVTDRCVYFEGNEITAQPISFGSDAASAFLRKYPLNDRSRPGMGSCLSRRTPCNKVLASPWTAKSPVCYRREVNLDVPSNSTYKEEVSEEFLTSNPVVPLTRRSSIDNISTNSAHSVSSDNIHNVELKSNDSNNNFAYVPTDVEKSMTDTENNPWHDFTSKLEMGSNGCENREDILNETHFRKLCNNNARNFSVDDGNPHSIVNLISEADDDDSCATKCEICLKMFTSKCTLAAHMKTHNTQARYHCDQCDKSFSQLRNYKYHVSVHKGTKEFAATCNVCGKYFNDRGYLSSHMKIHRNRKEYQCPHCPKSFNQRVAYNMHVRIHTGVKPHQCEACGKAFSRKMLLKQHYRTHSGEKPYSCSVCNKRFADRSNMTLHMRLHSGVKPFSCSLCPKSFTKKHHLKTHLNYHTGNKPYACEKCGLTFSQSSNMRTHMKKCNSFSLQIPEQAFTAPGLNSSGLAKVEKYPKKNSDVFNIENLSRSSSIN